MPELVFYDHSHPLKRKWSSACEKPTALDSEPLLSRSRTQLPRLPSLADWANIDLLNRAVCPVDLPPVAVVKKEEQQEDDQPVHETPATPPKTTPMRNTSRERMKAEQAALRAQAAALENELACIQQIQNQRLTSCGKSESQGCSAWQAMAQQQWEQRIVAEKENKRLRTTVGGLMDEVKGLESLFKSRSSALMASLRQSSQLALQVQALLAEERPGASDDSPKIKSKHRKLSSSSLSSSSSSHPQQSPRDVAYAMEPWSSQSS